MFTLVLKRPVNTVEKTVVKTAEAIIIDLIRTNSKVTSKDLIDIFTRTNMTEQEINQLIQESKADTNLISDGYHTFGELYEHRIRLFITLCQLQKEHASKSRRHDDGVEWPGWIILGLFTEKGQQITYHLAASYWEELADITTLEKAPDYDSHSSVDVLTRLKLLGKH